MRRALALALLLTGCGTHPAPRQDSPGAQLEAAAERAGLIPDAAAGPLTGSWSLDTDRACVVPLSQRESRIGVLVDYGDAQGCVASGTVTRDGGRLDVRLGACRIRARFDGERIIFPAQLPTTCEQLCTGRATLEAFTVERISEARSEAETLRTPKGRPLCAA